MARTSVSEGGRRQAAKEGGSSDGSAEASPGTPAVHPLPEPASERLHISVKWLFLN